MWFDDEEDAWDWLEQPTEPMSTGDVIFLAILCTILGFCIACVIFDPHPFPL